MNEKDIEKKVKKEEKKVDKKTTEKVNIKKIFNTKSQDVNDLNLNTDELMMQQMKNTLGVNSPEDWFKLSARREAEQELAKLNIHITNPEEKEKLINSFAKRILEKTQYENKEITNYNITIKGWAKNLGIPASYVKAAFDHLKARGINPLSLDDYMLESNIKAFLKLDAKEKEEIISENLKLKEELERLSKKEEIEKTQPPEVVNQRVQEKVETKNEKTTSKDDLIDIIEFGKCVYEIKKVKDLKKDNKIPAESIQNKVSSIKRRYSKLLVKTKKFWDVDYNYIYDNTEECIDMLTGVNVSIA